MDNKWKNSSPYKETGGGKSENKTKYSSGNRRTADNDFTENEGASAYGLRRVKRSAESYRGRTAANGRNGGGSRAERPVTEKDVHRRAEVRRRAEALSKRRMRAAVLFTAAAACAVIILFMTPVFNIKQIVLQGNEYVTVESVDAKLGDLIGDNIFKTSKGSIKKKLLEIPYISEVSVKKRVFPLPSSITVTVKETHPAAYVLYGSNVVVVNSDLKVLDDAPGDTAGLPSISGISIQSYNVNDTIVTDSAEKEDILRELLGSFEATGLIPKITYINLEDLTDIRFNYDKRIDTECGSRLELERKIRMFAAAVNSPSISSEAMGAMDLANVGQAVFKP